MPMFRLTMLIAALVVAAPMPADAHSAGELYQDCNDSHGSVGRIACLSYLHGLMDGLAAANVLDVDKSAFHYCPPRGELSVSELRLIFLHQVDKRRDELSADAGLFLADALMKAFPCPSGT